MTDRISQPKHPAHHTVLSLSVTGGFLAGAKLEFVDGLNCIIGGRGTGKTTALEFLRFGLGLMPDPKVDQQRARNLDALVRANLGSGRLAVDVLTRTSMRYTAGRSVAESVQVTNENGAAVPVSLDRDQIFSADVFSQNEIEEIASSPTAQLALVDRFVEEEASSIGKELEQLDRQLTLAAADLTRLDEEIDDLRAKASELPIFEERLKGFAAVGGADAQRVNSAHAAKALRTSEAQGLDQVAGAIAKATKDVKAVQAAFNAGVAAHVDPASLRGPNDVLFNEIRASLDAFAAELEVAVRGVSDAGGRAEAKLKGHRGSLATLHATQEAEYRTLIAAHEEEGGKAIERATLEASHAASSAAAKQQTAKETERQALVSQRGALLKRVSELRDQRFSARKRVAERITAQFKTIRVSVTQSADVQRYRDLLADALKGVGMKQVVVAERLAQNLLPSELAQLVVTRQHEVLAKKSGLDQERARKVIDALAAGGLVYRIETVDLEDLPSIELLDGDTYKASPNLSTGQRCTTILPILLVQSERPLLIDQPEDNLDNAFVYETVVKALRAVKGARQIIFVTHNPNIPVLGHAERVFVFTSDGKRGTLKQVGTVDECKGQIETILEGGKDAFLERKARYGH